MKNTLEINIKKKEAYKERGEALRSNDKFKKIFEISDKMTELSYAEEAYRKSWKWQDAR